MKKSGARKSNLKETSPIPGVRFVKKSNGIAEYELEKNGLQILLSEDHAAPVATVMVTYKVGSRNEAVGHTGSTHILEHLLFKGSKNFHKKTAKHIDWLQDIGALLNATTWFDRTNYFETLPSEYIADALAIEADRMRHAFIREEDLRTEMVVVRNEFEIGENDPLDVLNTELWASAYRAHPYHHPTIGWRTDIENVPITRLQEFYNTFYWPNNAAVTIIGDFDTPKVLSLIKKFFGKHKRSPRPIPDVYTEEPKQEGERRFVIERSGEVGMLGVGFKAPSARHEDAIPLFVMATILAHGKSSRLERLLVDGGHATGVSLHPTLLRDPGLIEMYVTLAPGETHEAVEKLLLDALEVFKQGGVTGKELARATRQLEAQVAWSRDGSYAIAGSLNETIASGDWTLYTEFLRSIGSVTVEDIARVARKYLRKESRTVGYFVPKTAHGHQIS